MPRAERWVWAFSLLRGSASARSFRGFCEANDICSGLATAGAMTDRSRQACQKMWHAGGSVLRDEHTAYFKASVRLLFSFDDRDQVNLTRVRLTRRDPRLESKDIIVDAGRDYGHDIADHANVVYQSLLSLCKVRKGRREPGKFDGPADMLPEENIKHLKKHHVC